MWRVNDEHLITDEASNPYNLGDILGVDSFSVCLRFAFAFAFAFALALAFAFAFAFSVYFRLSFACTVFILRFS